MNEFEKVIFIVGPTAVGKSQAGIQLAQAINGEIISCDSMQVYREINIASNKPTAQQLAEVPHHLVGIISIKEDFNVSRFNELALEAMKTIHQQGRIPIIVGGSGMYMQVLLDGIFEAGPRNDLLRKGLNAEAQQKGNQFLHDKLRSLDPVAAEKIHVNNLKRVVRALEVCIIEKKPISEIQKKRRGIWGEYDITIFGLNCNRDKLYASINQRVEQMFTNGIIDEIKALRGHHVSDTAQCIIGVDEVHRYPEDEHDLNEAKELMKLNTRHFAKRQLTWFRKDERIHWIDIADDDTIGNIVGKMLREIKK